MGADGDPMAVLDARMRAGDRGLVRGRHVGRPRQQCRKHQCSRHDAGRPLRRFHSGTARERLVTPLSSFQERLEHYDKGRPKRAFTFPVDAIACRAQMAPGIGGHRRPARRPRERPGSSYAARPRSGSPRIDGVEADHPHRLAVPRRECPAVPSWDWARFSDRRHRHRRRHRVPRPKPL